MGVAAGVVISSKLKDDVAFPVSNHIATELICMQTHLHIPGIYGAKKI